MSELLLKHFDLLAQAPDGVKRLRELILTLAVQGKLVPQDPSDEPASVLLARIRAEKDRLAAEGKIKRDKPLPPIADEEKPFELPDGWEWVRFGEVAQHNSGKTLDSGRNSGTLRNYITTSNLYWGRFELGSVRQMLIRNDELERCSARKGDLLICEGGEAGRAAVWYQDFDICFQNHIHRARFFGEINPFYAYRVFEYLNLTGQINKFRKGVGISNMSSKSLASIPLTLPRLEEQARIVVRVDELMHLCDAVEAKGQLDTTQHAQLLQTLLGTLTDSASPEKLAENWQRVAAHFDLLLDRPEAVDALEQTILQLAVRGLLVPQDPSDEPASVLLERIRAEKDRLIAEGKIKRDKPLPPSSDEEKQFGLPPGWEWSRLEQLSSVTVDCPHSTPNFVEHGRLCLDTNSFKQGKLIAHKLRYVDDITFAERIARLVPQPGDLVFAREGSVGESLIIPDGVEACLGQRVMLFRFTSAVSTEFVQLGISSTSFLTSLLSLHKGIGAKHVNVGDMRKALVPVPPLPEQTRIVARVEALRQLCSDLRAKLAVNRSTQSQLADALVAELV